MGLRSAKSSSRTPKSRSLNCGSPVILPPPGSIQMLARPLPLVAIVQRQRFAAMGRDIREVRGPQLARLHGLEPLVDLVQRTVRLAIADRHSHEFASHDAAQSDWFISSQAAHQAGAIRSRASWSLRKSRADSNCSRLERPLSGKQPSERPLGTEAGTSAISKNVK